MSHDDTDQTTDLSAGIFMWDISGNVVRADGAAAFLFGLDPVEAEAGLPIERFIGRVHEDDRAELARKISETMRTSEPYQMQYRVLTTENVWVEVMAFGHCFQNGAGQPEDFSGIVHPVPLDHNDQSPLWHLMVAHELFKREGEAQEAALVLDLLKRLSNPGKNPLKIRLM